MLVFEALLLLGEVPGCLGLNNGKLVVVVLVVSEVLTKVFEFPKAKVLTELQVFRNAFLKGVDAQM